MSEKKTPVENVNGEANRRESKYHSASTRKDGKHAWRIQSDL